MTVFSNQAFDDHEAVQMFCDRETGLRGVIAIHSSYLGPGFGGCRYWRYGSESEAVEDALRLSQGMSYKNALAGIPFGGGKAVIMADRNTPKSPALFEAFGRAVDRLCGDYITAEDVGVSVQDMEAVARTTRHVSGLASKGGVAGGDPSPKTAMGVFHGIGAAVARAFGRNDLEGLRVGVQGIGNVGYYLCSFLADAGARLTVADINRDSTIRAADEFGATIESTDNILAADVDVVAPCALGGVITADLVGRLQAKVIAGAANNQLADATVGDLLRQNRILYAPDYVINSGGIVSVAAEYQGNASDEDVDRNVALIADRLTEIFAKADKADRPTARIADEMAREAINRSEIMPRPMSTDSAVAN